jgi:hypothetical protein
MFKYFNPLWLMQNFLQANLNPVTIGAGVGAVGAAVTGKSPIKGALLGGATGGLFGGKESLFGDKIGGLFSGAQNAAPGVQALGGQIPSVGINNFGNAPMLTDVVPYDQLANSSNNLFGSWNIGQGTLPATTTTGAFADGINLTSGSLAGGLPNATPFGAVDTSRLFNYTNPTTMDKITGFGTDIKDWAVNNPSSAIGTGLQVGGALSPQQQQQQVGQPAIPPITKGTYNTAPSLGMGQNEKVATRMQFTPNQLNLYPSLYRGGF